MEAQGAPVSISTALGYDKELQRTLPLQEFDLKASERLEILDRTRLRVMHGLENSKNPEKRMDYEGRVYHWIDSLGVAAGHDQREAFDNRADRCLIESVKNVVMWAFESTGNGYRRTSTRRALAVVSATFGGGAKSHNRLHILVADNGIGIVDSVHQKASDHRQPIPRTDNSSELTATDAMNVIPHLVHTAQSDRKFAGTKDGHGLYTMEKCTEEWHGTMDVISAFAPGRVIHYGKRGQTGEWNHREYSMEGIRGTLVHLSLDAICPARERTPINHQRVLTAA